MLAIGSVLMIPRGFELADLIKFNNIGFGTQFAQKSFGCLAIWAIGLAEDGYITASVSIRNLDVLGVSSLPTAFSSMMLCALVFAADMAAGFTLEPKNLRRNEMLGNPMADLIRSGLVSLLERAVRYYKFRGFRLHGVSSIEAQGSVINRISSLDDDIDAYTDAAEVLCSVSFRHVNNEFSEQQAEAECASIIA